ncbi:MAG: hypothetical protein B5766_02605 [Candidatus Lumbricidophila eiseniae]|uniref:MFS transporter permease n=1 Tax=Candidatus Lumbricidiphila eiseniae TaxID=1969409 RepID=A0A2A6FTW5_9MICO|nr:MAG: hypothetical protein B5766_02605 [Candidatus Lumbricidophila eiseniae]
MILRGIYRWQFLAIFALPLWLVVGWGIFGHGGWGLIGLFLAVPITAVSLALVTFLTRIRPSVRAERTLSWRDLPALALWHGSLLGLGFYGSTGMLFVLLGILGALCSFWLAVRALVHDGGRRMSDTVAEHRRTTRDDTIVVHEKHD